MKVIGLDIGTTTICGVLMNTETGEILQVKTVDNDSRIENEQTRQNPARICECCERLIEEFERTEVIDAIGLTGQMHGIVYLDKQGKAVSDLYTWQEQCGNDQFEDGKSYVEYIEDKTGRKVATGYGMVTYFVHQKKSMIPEQAAVFCTIPDYAALYLSGASEPLMHRSMAGSLGLYSLPEGCFDMRAIEQLELDRNLLPTIAKEEFVVGFRNGKVPVIAALGDNQASYLGTVQKEGGVLVNIGTGSQISAVTHSFTGSKEIEFRPYIGDKFLAVGSSLCGGYAYALTKKFVERTAELLGIECVENIYEKMNASAEAVYQKGNALNVDTRLKGTRSYPNIRGSITDISVENFLPEYMICGVLEGIVKELKEYYDKFPEDVKQEEVCYMSGNGVRRNPLMQRIIKDEFGKETVLGKYVEEAACGAALFAGRVLAG